MIHATLLIAGTSIGAGMLGLPVETGGGGFFPSLILLAINWIIMMGTAFLLVEVLSKHPETNFITLSQRLFGRFFKVCTFTIYIFFFLSLTLSYVKGGGVFLSQLLPSLSGPFGYLLFLLIFVPLIIFGSRILGVANTFLTVGMLLSFMGLVSLGIKRLSSSFLTHVDWKLAALSYPMFITSFGFHGCLPSLYSYLGNKRDLKIAILTATSLTALVYACWQLVVMGVVPLSGENSLTEALLSDQTAVSPLKIYLKSSSLHFFAQMFYFLALTTSFLGVGLGLIDFLLDTFKQKGTSLNRMVFACLIYIPAFCVAQTPMRVFYLSLKFGGGSASFYLLILLPILLFLRNRKGGCQKKRFHLF